MKKMVIFLGCFILSLYFICADNNNFIVKEFNDFNKMIPGLLKKYNVSGASIGVINNGELTDIISSGYSDKENKILIDENTIFQVASNSKTFTAWGIMKLYERGKINIDSPVENYISRWKFPSSNFNTKEITIRKLLSHTAGLSNRAYAGYLPGTKLPSIEESLSSKENGVKVIAKPGSSFNYSGGGYTILQMVIEENSGLSFNDYMKKEIFLPLNMIDSSFIQEKFIKDKTSKAYDLFGNNIPNYYFSELAAAGLYTNVKDFSKFVVYNIRLLDDRFKNVQNTVIKKENFEEMLKPYINYGNYGHFGLGYIVLKLKDNKRLIMHGGTNRGWRSQFIYIPEDKNGLVLLTNSDDGENLYKDLIINWTKRKLGYIPDYYKKTLIMRIILYSIAVIFFILSILFSIKLYLNIKDGKKIFLLDSSGLIKKIFAFVKFVLFIFLAIFWYSAFYTGLLYKGWILATQMSNGFGKFSISFIIFCLVSSISSLFIKLKNESKEKKQ